MRALLIYPSFPASFWSYEAILRLVGKKALMPPLGLLTVAALLPQTWECRLVDRNVRPVSPDDWAWADIVLVSGMLVQKTDMLAVIAEAHARGKSVVAGGPYPTALPDELRAAGADFLVLDEAELTIQPWVDALAAGAREGTFSSGGAKPDVTASPVPRYDLLDFDAYDSMCVQFSRGCPFTCEFCDIIVLYGRRPRTKTPAQVLTELDRLYALGWRGPVFLVDDNFIGNPHAARALLRELRDWQRARRFPFHFDTEATVDLARDPDLLRLMVECHFGAVFIGVETVDHASLARSGKHQNLRNPLADDVETITRAGIRVMAGFIVGFDGEASGADRRIVDFVEQTAIPTAMVTVLQALPGTALWHRLEREGRLLGSDAVDLNQTCSANFAPTRPIDEIASEAATAFAALYDPVAYLDRTWRYFLRLGVDRPRPDPPTSDAQTERSAADAPRRIPWHALRALLVVAWRQGVIRRSRWRFWHHLASMACRRPDVLAHYLTVCAHNEHFLVFRGIVGQELRREAQATPHAPV